MNPKQNVNNSISQGTGFTNEMGLECKQYGIQTGNTIPGIAGGILA